MAVRAASDKRVHDVTLSDSRAVHRATRVWRSVPTHPTDAHDQERDFCADAVS